MISLLKLVAKLIDLFEKNNKQEVGNGHADVKLNRVVNPKKTFEVEFTIYLCSRVPRLVRKCFGKYDYPINIADKDDDDDFHIVKSYGTSYSTDKNGKQQQKYGSQYNHFMEACLLRYVNEMHDKQFEDTFPFEILKIDLE